MSLNPANKCLQFPVGSKIRVKDCDVSRRKYGCVTLAVGSEHEVIGHLDGDVLRIKDPSDMTRGLRFDAVDAEPVFYKPGDKVYVICDEPRRVWPKGGPGGTRISLDYGTVITVKYVNADGVVFFDYGENMENFYFHHHNVAPAPPELATEPKPCVCPRENFAWNGRGCVCGGI